MRSALPSLDSAGAKDAAELRYRDGGSSAGRHWHSEMCPGVHFHVASGGWATGPRPVPPLSAPPRRRPASGRESRARTYPQEQQERARRAVLPRRPDCSRSSSSRGAEDAVESLEVP